MAQLFLELGGLKLRSAASQITTMMSKTEHWISAKTVSFLLDSEASCSVLTSYSGQLASNSCQIISINDILVIKNSYVANRMIFLITCAFLFYFYFLAVSESPFPLLAETY